MNINNSGAASMTYPYIFTALEECQCPSSREKLRECRQSQCNSAHSNWPLSHTDLKGQKCINTVKHLCWIIHVRIDKSTSLSSGQCDLTNLTLTEQFCDQQDC